MHALHLCPLAPLPASESRRPYLNEGRCSGRKCRLRRKGRLRRKRSGEVASGQYIDQNRKMIGGCEARLGFVAADHLRGSMRLKS
jgi:hypothetical protein